MLKWTGGAVTDEDVSSLYQNSRPPSQQGDLENKNSNTETASLVEGDLDNKNSNTETASLVGDLENKNSNTETASFVGLRT